MTIPVDLAYTERYCALCYKPHAPCVFTAGSLRCVRENCPNPHHRTDRTAS